jgi:hypothetical protein
VGAAGAAEVEHRQVLSTTGCYARRRPNPQNFLDYEMPLHSRYTQMTLKKVRAEVDALKCLLAETAAELNALLPAILDLALKRELGTDKHTGIVNDVQDEHPAGDPAV